MTTTADKQRQAEDAFIATWGKMGSAWGISRTVAEIHALLYLSEEPLCTDDVMERLQISRGNASMSVRALIDWGIVYRAHKRGDRKEYYEAERDVWAMFQTIMRERKKRELDPVIASLYEIRDLTPADADGDESLARHNQRLDDMLEFVSALDKLGQNAAEAKTSALKTAMKMLNKAF